MNDAITLSSSDEEIKVEHEIRTKRKNEVEPITSAKRHCEKSSDSNELKRVQPITVSTTKNSKSIELEENEKLFEEFISCCRSCDKSKEMEIILQKGKKLFQKIDLYFKSSSDLSALLAEKTNSISLCPKAAFIYIKDVYDEFLCHKLKLKKRSKVKEVPLNNCISEDNTNKVEEEGSIENEIEIDEHKLRNIKRLSKTRNKLLKMIKKLEEKEIDFDDDDDSTYIQLQRYKDRLLKVYTKECELWGDKPVTNMKMKKITCNVTSSPTVNRCIENFVNEKKIFPDYSDILKLLKRENSKNNLEIKGVLLAEMAKKAFVHVGEQLQRLRQFNDWNIHSMYLMNNADPALEDEELNSKLLANKKVSNLRIKQVLEDFVEKENIQSQLEEKSKSKDDNSLNDSLITTEDGENTTKDCLVGSKTESEVNKDKEMDNNKIKNNDKDKSNKNKGEEEEEEEEEEEDDNDDEEEKEESDSNEDDDDDGDDDNEEENYVEKVLQGNNSDKELSSGDLSSEEEEKEDEQRRDLKPQDVPNNKELAVDCDYYENVKSDEADSDKKNYLTEKYTQPVSPPKMNDYYSSELEENSCEKTLFEPLVEIDIEENTKVMEVVIDNKHRKTLNHNNNTSMTLFSEGMNSRIRKYKRTQVCSTPKLTNENDNDDCIEVTSEDSPVVQIHDSDEEIGIKCKGMEKIKKLKQIAVTVVKKKSNPKKLQNENEIILLE